MVLLGTVHFGEPKNGSSMELLLNLFLEHYFTHKHIFPFKTGREH